jgi:hypothetical protein
MIEKGSVSEALADLNNLTKLSAEEDFIAISCHKTSRLIPTDYVPIKN